MNAILVARSTLKYQIFRCSFIVVSWFSILLKQISHVEIIKHGKRIFILYFKKKYFVLEKLLFFRTTINSRFQRITICPIYNVGKSYSV